MRAEQKIILSCRQTGERAERLLEWLDQSRSMLRSQDCALRIDVQGIANELLTLVEAVDQPATAGVIGAWGSARAELVGALMNDAPGAGTETEAQPSLSRDRVLAMLPRDVEGGVAARVRFGAETRAEAPFRYPIRLALLSQLDLVAIIAGAYLVHVPARRRRWPAPDAIAASLSAKAQEIVHQAFSGISRRDIDSLRDALHAAAPESRNLRELDASGYWDMLGGLIPHLPEALRRRAFALLWGDDPALTALFERLSDAIELMGFSSEVFVGFDAVFGRDPSSGWMVRHSESLLASDTIRFEGRADVGAGGNGGSIRISSRHGRAAETERFILAALVAEARIPVDPARLPLLETADIVVLPAPRPAMLWPNGTAHRAEMVPSRAPLTAAEAIEIFAAQKASYLIDQAVRRHTLTSLLVAADVVDRDGGTEIDAVSTAQIANWIEITQGETAHARERRRTGIAILAADGGAATAATDALPGSGDADQRLAATVAAVLDGNADWALEWTPNRPFRNVFTWSPQRPVSTRLPGVGRQMSADILRFDRHRGTEGGAMTVPASDLAATYDLVNLQHAVSQSTTTPIHLQQLSNRLSELRRALAARFLRMHLSNDPTGVVEWRRQMCHVACNRLQQSAQVGGFGRLQRALMFTEGEALAVLARLKSEDPRQRSAQPNADLRSLEPGRLVERCLEAWIAGMRQGTRSPALMRAIGVPGHVLSHIVDELVIGAVRIGLQDKLSEAVRRIQLSAARAVDCENSIAALMERGINAYLESLDPGARALRSSIHRDQRFGGAGQGATARADGGRGSPSGARLGQLSATVIAEEWAEMFSDLIEANILGAGLLGGAGHLNRELGEVLSAISTGPFEGFQ